MASAYVSGYAASIHDLIPKKIFDNISIAHPTWYKLYSRKKSWTGGTQYQPNMLSASDTEGGMFDMTSTALTLPTTQTDKTVAAVYNMKGWSNPYHVTPADIVAGGGELAIITTKEKKLIQATNRHVEIPSVQIFTGDVNAGATQIWGLGKTIATNDATPFVGQIDQSADTWWAPGTITAATTFSSLDTIEGWIAPLTDGSDVPDWLITGQTLYQRLRTLMLQMGVNTKINNDVTKVKVGEIMYENLECWCDKGSAASHVYVLNSNYMELWISSVYDFWSSGFSAPTGERYQTGFLQSAGMMAYTNRRRLGGGNSVSV